ncbi:hypothetical protein ACFSCX_06790 [Bacillus salitolerans]|uniref:DUF3854 domain-containing protein n=1 Tax=Bacillus salitolerans TaxID=1437434 RepID=A0ABW4LP60_9BACI
MTVRNTLRRTRIPNWYELYREACPVCGKVGGCMINNEGAAVACIRTESDTTFSKNSSAPSWLHFLKGKKKREKIDAVAVEKMGEEKRENSFLHTVFRGLIDCTTLSDAHYEHLTSPSRQLTDEQIYVREYRSFPEKPWATAKEIQSLTGIQDFTGVPGFFEAKGKYGPLWNIAGGEGILIPFRNHYNEIVGFQYRVDNPPNVATLSRGEKGLQATVKEQPNLVQVSYEGEIIFEEYLELKKPANLFQGTKHFGTVELKKGNRYFWVSSGKKPKGTGAGDPTPVHIAVPSERLRNWKTGTLMKANTAWISEGPLKCDIASELTSQLFDPLELDDVGTTFLALPGAGGWRLAIPILQEMGVKKVNFAFDADSMSNPFVKVHLLECLKECKKLGFEGNLVIWNENEYKGIDDALISRVLPQFKRLF